MRFPAQLLVLAGSLLTNVLLAGAAGTPALYELADGGSQQHDLQLEAGRPYRLEVEQLGIDVAIAVRDSAGSPLLELDNPLERWGTESGIFTPPSGLARVEIRSALTGVGEGRYRLRIETFDGASPELAAAEQAWTLASASQDPETALAGFRDAAERFAGLGLGEREAAAHHAGGALEKRLGRSAAARELFRRALELWQSAGAGRPEAAAWNDLGLAHWELGELAEAEASFERAEQRLVPLGEPAAEADVSQNRCLVLHARGDLEAAVGCYETARDRFRQLGEQRWEATALNNLGYAFFSLGEPTPAIQSYRDALALRRAHGDPRGEAQTLNNLAVVYRGLGELDEALTAYDAARSLQQALGDRRQEAATLSNLGVAYRDLGDGERARVYFEQALALRVELDDRRGQVATLGRLGELRCEGGETEAGLALIEQALALARATDDGRRVGLLESRRGECLAKGGQFETARSVLESVARRSGAEGDRIEQALARRQLGEVLLAQGRPREALTVLHETLESLLAAGNQAKAAEVRASLARAHRALGDLETARTEAGAALAAIETLRRRIRNPELRAGFLAAQRDAYEVLVGALAEMHRRVPGAGHDLEAFEISEQARARTLLDLLDDSRAELARGLDPALVADRRDLRRRLYLKSDRQLSAKPADVRARELEIVEIMRRLDEIEARMRASGPRYAALVEPQIPKLDEIRELLGAETVLLEVLLGEQRSWLWRVGSDGLALHELPGRAEIERRVRRLHASWSTPARAEEAEATAAAAELSRWLLQPIWADLTGGRVRRIAVAADGALHLLAFGALPMPDGSGEPLLERFEVVAVPSAAALAAGRRLRAPLSPPPRRALVLADPVFDRRDPRFAASLAQASQARPATLRSTDGAAGSASLDRLGFSAEEARAIQALDPGRVEMRTGFAARTAELLTGELRDYGFLHLASHGVVDTEHPALSGLVLSRFDPEGHAIEGWLRLADVYDLDLATDLVVLSGCRTALGRELRGEGLQGLARGFLHAGSRSVAASLWAVQDRAAAELMAALYRHLWREGLAPAAALRAAQLELRARHRWRSPFYWAPWVLQGDWQR